MLAKYFVQRYAATAGKKIRTIDKKSLDLLQAYHWPGNVRELQNAIERSVVLCKSETLTIDESWTQSGESCINTGTPSDVVPLNQALVDREKQIIEAALEECRGRIFGPRGAAARLGIPRSTLESKIRSLGIDKYSFKSEARALERKFAGGTGKRQSNHHTSYARARCGCRSTGSSRYHVD